MLRRAIYPGSFDPITYGHIDLIKRALGLFDEIVVAVAENASKQPLFSLDERAALTREALTEVSKTGRVQIVTFNGLLVDLAGELQAVAIIRGLRVVSDFEFEFQLALANRKLRAELETVFLMPKESLVCFSSSIVKEIARLGGDLSAFVPPHVQKALQTKLIRK